MKILLVKPSIRFKTTVPKPSLGLAYIAAYLEKKSNHETKIIDMYSHEMSLDSILSEIQVFSPGMIGFSAATPQINIVGNIAKTIKENIGKDICLTVGGPHPSTVPERTLIENPYLDIAVFGEGEETMFELSNALDNGESLSSVAGIAYRDQGKIKINSSRPIIKNIDDIPFPAWHKLDMNLYLNFNFLFNKKVFPIITSRGCTNRCTFCDTHGVWLGKLRMRSAKNIVDEMSALNATYGVNHIDIYDDNFTINKQRAELICNEIENRDLRITWNCNGRVDRVNKEMLERMKKAGCIYISYGIESGSQEILDFTRKNITLEQIRSAVKLTKESGLRVGGYFMMGFPPETEEHIKKTVELIKELDLDWVSELSILVPYPGTEIYNDMKREGLIIREDWDNYYIVLLNQIPIKSDIKSPPKDGGISNDPFPGGVPMESNIKTRYIDNRQLLQIKIKYDKEISSYMYKKVLLQHLKRLDKTAAKFIKNPVSFIRSAYRMASDVSKSI